jgi:hypothetical protein
LLPDAAEIGDFGRHDGAGLIVHRVELVVMLAAAVPSSRRYRHRR